MSIKSPIFRKPVMSSTSPKEEKTWYGTSGITGNSLLIYDDHKGRDGVTPIHHRCKTMLFTQTKQKLHEKSEKQKPDFAIRNLEYEATCDLENFLF